MNASNMRVWAVEQSLVDIFNSAGCGAWESKELVKRSIDLLSQQAGIDLGT